MKIKRSDLNGKRFGRLTVIRYEYFVSKNGKKRLGWLCVCDCGKQTHPPTAYLLNKKTESCGCQAREKIVAKAKTHGMEGTPEYRAWRGMIRRCTYIKEARYDAYGGRGIKTCDEWRNSFSAFYAFMGNRPSKNHSVDRINVNGNYEPGNVRWATTKEQGRNKRSNVWLSAFRESDLISYWAKKLGSSLNGLCYRLKKHSLEEIIIKFHPSYHKKQFCAPLSCQFTTSEKRGIKTSIPCNPCFYQFQIVKNSAKSLSLYSK